MQPHPQTVIPAPDASALPEAPQAAASMPVATPVSRESMPRPAASGAPRDLQRLWMALQQRPFRTLVLAPSHPGPSLGALARGLAAVASEAGDGPVQVLEVGDVDLGAVGPALERLRSGGRMLVTVEDLERCPAGLAVVRAADAVLLCVWLGLGDRRSAERAVELIGRERIVGAAALAPERAR